MTAVIRRFHFLVEVLVVMETLINERSHLKQVISLVS